MYDLAPLYAKGFDGKGRTIVIIDPYGSPTLARDLTTFDTALGVPAPPSLRVLQPVGKVPAFDPSNAEMVRKAGETTGDVETAHEIAPGASIVVIETPVGETLSGGGFPQFIAADNYVATHHLGDVISQSFGLPEQNAAKSALLSLRSAFVNDEHADVTVLAASNDLGVTGPTANRGALRPSDCRLAGIGPARHRSRRHDVAPRRGRQANFAGYRLERQQQRRGREVCRGAPLGQHWRSVQHLRSSFVPGLCGGDGREPPWRTGCLHECVPQWRDSPLWVLYREGHMEPRWGNECRVPEFAGIIAIADQYAGKDLGLINPALYRLETAKAPGIVDVTRGTNTVSFSEGGKSVTVKGYPAKPGYDLVTGVGTIDAALLVPELSPHH